MSYLKVIKEGIVIEDWDDVSRTVTYYRDDGVLRPTAPGGEAPNPRLYTPDENDDADARAAEFEQETLITTLRSGIDQVITDLQTEKARVQPVIDKTNAQITPGDTKDVARAAKRIADAVIDALRIIKNAE